MRIKFEQIILDRGYNEPGHCTENRLLIDGKRYKVVNSTVRIVKNKKGYTIKQAIDAIDLNGEQ